jgi:hypothetical protein
MQDPTQTPASPRPSPSAHRAFLSLVVLLGIAVGVAIVFRSDLELERARADALAERVAALEAVERPESVPGSDTNARVREVSPAPSALAVERPVESPSSDAVEQPSKPKREFRGSLQARQQVERLQIALANGTPLQDYQIQALITAIDQVRDDIENEKKAIAKQPRASAVDWQTESRARLVQAAADILFESQLEKLIDMLDREP